MASILWEVLMVHSQGKHLENVAVILKQRGKASFLGCYHQLIIIGYICLGDIGPHVQQKEDR